MSDTTRITLGGREYNVPPLKIRQSRAIDVFLAKPLPIDPVAQADASWDRMLGVVCLALGDAYPDVTPEKISDGQGGVDSVIAAYRVVLGMMGFERTSPAAANSQDAPSGEAEPAAGAAPA